MSSRQLLFSLPLCVVLGWGCSLPKLEVDVGDTNESTRTNETSNTSTTTTSSSATISDDSALKVQSDFESSVFGTLEIPVGAIAIDATVSIREGSSLSQDDEILGILGDNELDATGSAYIITSDSEANASAPMKLDLPIPETGLALTQENFETIYVIAKYVDYDEYGLIKIRIIPNSDLTIGDVVSFETIYFGSYQVVVPKEAPPEDLLNKEHISVKPIEGITTVAITNKLDFENPEDIKFPEGLDPTDSRFTDRAVEIFNTNERVREIVREQLSLPPEVLKTLGGRTHDLNSPTGGPNNQTGGDPNHPSGDPNHPSGDPNNPTGDPNNPNNNEDGNQNSSSNGSGDNGPPGLVDLKENRLDEGFEVILNLIEQAPELYEVIELYHKEGEQAPNSNCQALREDSQIHPVQVWEPQYFDSSIGHFGEYPPGDPGQGGRPDYFTFRVCLFGQDGTFTSTSNEVIKISTHPPTTG